MNKLLRIGVLGSGKGSNFQAIADSITSGTLQAEIVCVISDVKDAFILERARKIGIKAYYIDAAPFKTKLEGEAEDKYIKVLEDLEVDIVALAGFMRIIKKKMLAKFPYRIVNIHPSLLPSFPGMEAWKQALSYGVKVTGCTVHFVDDGTDTGPIILQKTVPVYDDDTPEKLHARIQVEEHKAYPEALQIIAENRIKIEGRVVKIVR